MATTTSDVHDALVKAGIERQAVDELMRRAERRSGPSAMSILIGGFGLLAIGIGWVKSDVQAVDARLSGLETSVSGLDARLSGLETSVSGLDARLSGLETSVSERLTRIETILEERLPARR